MAGEHKHEWYYMATNSAMKEVAPGVLAPIAPELSRFEVTCGVCGITGTQAMQQRLVAIEAENAALREIAEAVAAVAVDEQRQVERCMYCSYWFTGWPISHAAACPVTKARALLGIGVETTPGTPVDSERMRKLIERKYE